MIAVDLKIQNLRHCVDVCARTAFIAQQHHIYITCNSFSTLSLELYYGWSYCSHIMAIISEDQATKAASPSGKTAVVLAAKEPVITPLESIEPPFANIPEKLNKYCSTQRQFFATVDTEKCSAEIYVCNFIS